MVDDMEDISRRGLAVDTEGQFLLRVGIPQGQQPLVKVFLTTTLAVY